jgi:phosphohistidine phosphatase
MKRLLLLRHAKAVPSSPAGDFERELAPRGRRDATIMGAFLRDEGLRPDRILASPARRTRQTAELAATAFDPAPEVVYQRSLYLAEPHLILELIRDTDPAVETLMVIGHNPGIADLANLMTISGDPQARELMQESFPTAALAVIDLPEDLWQGVSFYEGVLQRFVRPKHLS